MTTLHTNPPRPARDWVKAHRFPGSVSRFAGASLLGALGVAALTAIAIDAEPVQVALAAALFLVGALFAGSRMMRDHPHPALGLANLVTLTRLGLTACLVVPIFSDNAASWPIFVLAITALCLDGIDGWLARWQRLSSRFGAAFDMEVDSALGLVLALNAFTAGTAGPAVLLLGVPHYLFAAAGRVQPWLRRPLPERIGRKTVCVIQIAALIALQLPVLPDFYASVIVTIAALALIWSFGRDILWLWRRRA